MTVSAKAGQRILTLPPSALLLAFALGVAGCQRGEVEFTPNRMQAVNAELVTPHREDVTRVIAKLFGTPNQPRVPQGVDLDITKLAMAAGEVGYVRDSSGDEYQQRGLYRQHCASCHGVSGDGLGPAASMLNPYPRNFRPGKFKFKSTYMAAKPIEDDLRCTLINGIPGTAMPAFSVLDAAQIDALVEYVHYLSMRGQVERQLIALVADEYDSDWLRDTTDDPFDPAGDEDDANLVDEIVAEVAASWQRADDAVVLSPDVLIQRAAAAEEPPADSIRLGGELFVSSRTKCVDCHGNDGTAGGGALQVQLKELDDWNREVDSFCRETAALAEQLATKQARLAQQPPDRRDQAAALLLAELRQLRQRQEVVASLLPVQLARPRNLQSGVWHGGGDPEDLYRRIHQGIAGTPMPGHGSPRPDATGALSDEEIVNLVDFLLSGAKPSDSPL